MQQFQITHYQNLFFGPKLPTSQICHNHLREATHNTINFWHFQVPANFLTEPNIVYRPQGLCVVFKEGETK